MITVYSKKFKNKVITLNTLEELENFIFEENTTNNICKGLRNISDLTREKLRELFDSNPVYSNMVDFKYNDLKRIFGTHDGKTISSEGSLIYWLLRGYTEDEAKENITKAQRLRSKYCVEYWINHGYTEDEAIKKISEIQRKQSKLSLKSPNSSKNNKEKSAFCIEYWLAKGHSEEKAKELLYELQSSGSKIDTFIKKYGKIEGTKKYNEMKVKKTHLGKDNWMYGKSAPLGAGRGISGKYKSFYFRSLYEYYFIKQHENENIEECDVRYSKYTVKLPNGRTYRPDFRIGNVVYEIKPKGLCNTEEVINKSKAFREKFSGVYEYRIITEDDLIMDKNMLKCDVDSGLVVIDKNKYDRYLKNVRD